MPDEVKKAPAAAPENAPAQKDKPKSEKVKVKLIGAGSCNYEGIVLKKNETVELEASQAEQFMQSGLFERV